MSDIFISYSRRDTDKVKALYEEIKQETGVSPWIDLLGIETGAQFEDVIFRAIDACRVLIFVVSDSSLRSRWTRREVVYARNIGKKICPVNIDGTKLRGWFKTNYAKYDCIDYFNDDQKKKLFRDLNSWCPQAQMPERLKFLHVADLHLGATLCGKRLGEDQMDWIEKFSRVVAAEKPTAIVISGDIFNRARPSVAAMRLWEEFLTKVRSVDDKVRILAVGGNEDSVFLTFTTSFLEKQGIHFVGQCGPVIGSVVLRDQMGPVRFWLLPYMCLSTLRPVLGPDAPRNLSDALKLLLERQDIDPEERNVLVLHQMVSWGASDHGVIGGQDLIDGRIFDMFDYVALGHVHRPQSIGLDTIRYPGAPLDYSFYEAGRSQRGPLCVTMGGHGDVAIRQMVLPPLHPLKVLRGSIKDLLQTDLLDLEGCFLSAVVTDRCPSEAECDALRTRFRNLLRIESAAPAKMPEYAMAEPFAVRPVEGELASTENGEAFGNLCDLWRNRFGRPPEGDVLDFIRHAATSIHARQ